MLLSMSSAGDFFSLVKFVAGGALLLQIILSFKGIVYLLGRWWRWVDDRAQVYQYYDVPRYGEGSQENPLYRKAAAFVASLPSLEDSDSASVFSSSSKSNEFSLQLGPGQTAYDSFQGARIAWMNPGGSRLVLRVRRQDRTRVLRPYLQHIESAAEEIDQRRRELRLFINSGHVGGDGTWTAAAFTHPATLDTFAMDDDLKARVRADLEAFLRARSYYHRLGRAWRRSYLLYGESGTGKSTFAAAMARFLGFDVYDIDLWRTGGSEDLRALLMRTTPRSLILVEDLDRYLSIGGPDAATWILNFMDGIASSCGEERVMVFTMSHSKDGVDPAVLRPGRLDVHIRLPMCDFAMFKSLASSHLGLQDHKHFPQIEEIFQTGVRLNPAEVSDILIANRGSPGRALKTLIGALQGASSRGAARTTRNIWADRRPDDAQKGSSEASVVSSGVSSNGAGVPFVRDAPMREIRKLYGLIKMRSRRDNGVMPLEEDEAHAPSKLVTSASAASGRSRDSINLENQS